MRGCIALQSTSSEIDCSTDYVSRKLWGYARVFASRSSPKNGMQLELKHCNIRPWRMDDAESIARHANNRKIWLGVRDLFPHPYTIEDAREFLQRAITEQPEMKFCVEIERVAVGGIGVHPGQDVHRHTATIGYWLGEQFWGRGIMTEAVTAVTDFCFDNFPLRRISAEVFSNNPASARVLEKAGFTFEGRLKNHVLKDRKLLDSLLYARTT
jgi:ribosomal-protein-alanine N-acetyltransferase